MLKMWPVVLPCGFIVGTIQVIFHLKVSNSKKEKTWLCNVYIKNRLAACHFLLSFLLFLEF